MEYPRRITLMQAIAILTSTIIGVGVLALPLIAVRAADTGAPLVTLLGVCLAFAGLWIITILGMRFPNQSIIRYSERIVGRWPARLGSVMIIIFFMLLTALTAREFGAVVVTAVLRQTPLEVTVIVMLLLAGLPTRNDMGTFASIHLFYLPFLLAPALVIVALSLKNANLLYLQPLWGNEPSGMLTGVATVAALFQGAFIMSIVIPSMIEPRKAMKASIWGIMIAGGLYLVTVIATVAVFGPEEIKELLWPTLELARTTSLPANVLERLDIVFLFVWVTAVFTTLYSSYQLTVHAMSELFRLRDHKLFSLFLLPFIFIIALLPQNTLQLYQLIGTVGRFGLYITIVYPALLLLMAVVRGKRGDRSAANKAGNIS
ncbi:endospore germination permease [Brevibacillus humidisoli]|uniref:GerAB/ArcD/ProY family transporter n=1 Tax=Brevibacillus humidisoli TaxID=2895522 RepID=UPI001E490E10|nr:endospore germination permease [Brevibacillus humidisoli]UFJ40872.1 endospore germination permease [Brevibacillus humidisoli]